MLTIYVLSLFPNMIHNVISESIIASAIKSGRLNVKCLQIRDYTTNKQCQVDDYPYGGGSGMVLQADPLYNCWKSVIDSNGGKKLHTILMSARGKVYSQQFARALAIKDSFIIVCGHYEGVDERFIDECVTQEISIGDYVLTGGEIPALAIIDSVGRLLPGVLADESSYTDESHWSGLLEYPHYTRPEIWHGMRVPEVLLSGHHTNIAKWRHHMKLKITKQRRPDLFKAYKLSQDELDLLEKDNTVIK